MCNEFEAQIELSCTEFPRFYFLSKEKLIEVLSHTRDVRKYLDGIRLCFPGVNDLKYAISSNKGNLRTNLSSFDLDIHGIFENFYLCN